MCRAAARCRLQVRKPNRLTRGFPQYLDLRGKGARNGVVVSGSRAQLMTGVFAACAVWDSTHAWLPALRPPSPFPADTCLWALPSRQLLSCRVEQPPVFASAEPGGLALSVLYGCCGRHGAYMSCAAPSNSRFCRIGQTGLRVLRPARRLHVVAGHVERRLNAVTPADGRGHGAP